MIIDLRRLNATLPEKSFKFEGFETFLRMVRRNWWVIVLDLKEGYHHIMMDEKAQRLLGFKIENNWYHYRVLPFGLSQAVWIFSKVMRSIIGHWRSRGITCRNHVDDIWVMHPYYENLMQIRDLIILPDLRNCGFVLAEKGHLNPTQQLKFYRMILDTTSGIVSAPEPKINSMLQALKSLLIQEKITARHLSSVTGKLMSISRAFVYAKVRCMELYMIIDAENRKPWQWTIRSI